MDPSGPTYLLLILGGLLSFLSSLFLSAMLLSTNDWRHRAMDGSFTSEGTGTVLLLLSGVGLFAAGIFYFSGSIYLLLLVLLCFLCLALFLPFTIGTIFAHMLYKFLTPFLRPLTKLLGASVGRVLALPSFLFIKLTGPRTRPDVTEEDVLSIMDTAEEQDVIDEVQKEMIENIFELDDITAGDAMTHRTDVVGVSEDTAAIDVVRLSMDEGISRMPVYSKTLDHVLGIIYVKDLFLLLDNPENREKPATEFMRSVMYVPEACHARELLHEFKRKHSQIAIVVDEYGGTSGLVTMEDILEEIVGDMQDEFDDEEELIVAVGGGAYLCDGLADCEDVFDLFDLELPADQEEEDFDSVGGLITHLIGRIPDIGEQISLDYNGVHFAVQEVGERRILKILAHPLKGDIDEAL